jgi:hypothetical protein
MKLGRILIQAAVLHLVLLAGCISTQHADIDPNADLSALKSFLVVRQPNDDKGIEKLITAELHRHGKTAATAETLPSKIEHDAIVTYVDSWMWDLTMYLMKLEVEIRDPETQYIMAVGAVSHSSFARESPEEMARDVIEEIFQ